MSIEDKLEHTQMLFADVDNTLLCLHMLDDNNKRMIGAANYTDWLQYNVTHNAYLYCTSPKGMFNLISNLHANGTKIYGLTECTNSFEYNSKFNRLRECYPGVFEHHGDLISIDDRHKKVLIMKMVAKREGIPYGRIMFVDDSYAEVMEAFDAGFFAMHTTEALERFAN